MKYPSQRSMNGTVTRRTFLQGIGAGAVTLVAAGQVSAGNKTRYIVLATGSGVTKHIERTDFTVQRTLADSRVLLVVGPATDQNELAAVQGVQEVTRDVELQLEQPEFTEGTAESRDEAFFSLQWDKQDITTDAAIAHDTATGHGTKLAIIDTGTEFGHPDLKANTNEDEGRLFRRGTVQRDTGSVEVPVDWFDLSKGTKTVSRHVANDVLGHGTHVSGIVAASNTGETGVIGTAPDATIVPLRVFWWTEDADGNAVLFATFGDILTAISYAANINADALNMSLGTPPLPPQANAGGIRGALERVIDTATASGTVVVNAAGNDGTDLDGGDVMYPASVAGAMAISATGPNDKLVFYSNYGESVIDVGAPGGGYETLKKTLCADYDGDGDGEYPIGDPDDDGETEYKDCELPKWPFPTNLVLNTLDPDTLYGQQLGGAEYAYLAGTSMAAPQVTGTVGLVREVAPDASAETVEKAIEQGAELVQGRNADLGAGRLNCDKALDASVLKR